MCCRQSAGAKALSLQQQQQQKQQQQEQAIAVKLCSQDAAGSGDTTGWGPAAEDPCKAQAPEPEAEKALAEPQASATGMPAPGYRSVLGPRHIVSRPYPLTADIPFMLLLRSPSANSSWASTDSSHPHSSDQSRPDLPHSFARQWYLPVHPFCGMSLTVFCSSFLAATDVCQDIDTASSGGSEPRGAGQAVEARGELQPWRRQHWVSFIQLGGWSVWIHRLC